MRVRPNRKDKSRGSKSIFSAVLTPNWSRAVRVPNNGPTGPQLQPFGGESKWAVDTIAAVTLTPHRLADDPNGPSYGHLVNVNQTFTHKGFVPPSAGPVGQ